MKLIDECAEKPPIIFQILVTINFRGLTYKNPNKYLPNSKIRW